MNAEARRSIRIATYSQYFVKEYEKAGGKKHPTRSAEKAYRMTVARIKKSGLSPQTADEYMAEIVERVREKKE
jgi:hypothetical protein